MARGERAERGTRGPGLAIGAVFAAACLLALLWVVQAQEGCGGPPDYALPTEPFAGARVALVSLGSRDCHQVGGPGLPMHGAVATVSTADLDAWARDHGYAPTEDAWRPATALPFTVEPAQFDSTCGLLAVVTDTGMLTDYRVGSGELYLPCAGPVVMAPVCEGDEVHVAGSGTARIRSFAHPGLTPAAVAATGVPLPLLLAHAEAETRLATLGWVPANEVVLQSVAPSSGSTSPPGTVPADCVAWVAAGTGLGNATTFWETDAYDTDYAPDAFVVGLASCAASGSMPAASMRLDFHDRRGDGGDIAWRAFTPRAGPSVPSRQAAASVSIASVRAVAVSAATVPPGIERLDPP